MLQSKLSKPEQEVVKATTPMVAAQVLKITNCFYSKLFENCPAAKSFFNESHQQTGAQQKALADFVVAYASSIGEDFATMTSAFRKIVHRHVALNVIPSQYPFVHDNLIAAIGEVLESTATSETVEAWSQAVLGLANKFITAEEELYAEYEKRTGGWRGQRKFILVKREVVATDTVAFSFKPADGYSGGFVFTPGQYLTIRIPALGAAPRHYTITSKPGEATLQCTTRKVENGLVSSYMHDQLKEGQNVLLGVPCGLFTSRENINGHVLVGAGIGVTPMINLAAELGNKVKAAWTLQRSKDRLIDLGLASSVVATCIWSEGGRPNLEVEAEKLVATAGARATYYLCGPPQFMASFAHALSKAGVAADDMAMELFGTGSVSECPAKKLRVYG